MPATRPKRVDTVLPAAVADLSDAHHWLSPGLPDIDVPHWIPYLTAQELGLDRPKLTLDLATGALLDDVAPPGKQS